MDHQAKQDSPPPLPVLPRLERLDRLVQFLEERHFLSTKNSSSPADRKMEAEDQSKTLSSALEEVHHKGTLMERLAMLENRVLQLSLEMDVENTSRSSSSTIPIPERIGHGSSSTTVATRQNETAIISIQEKQDPLITQDKTFVKACEKEAQVCQKGRRQKRNVMIMRYRKWVGWFRMGC